MIEFAVSVQGQRVTCEKLRGELVSGLQGVKVHFTWSSEWQQLRRIGIFRAGSVSRNVMDLESQCVIPWEVLTEPGAVLMIGVQGTDESGTVVTPTLEAEMDEIQQGANPSKDPTADPQLPIWKWVQQLIEKTVDSITQLLKGGQEEIDQVVADGKEDINAITKQLENMIRDGNVVVQPAEDLQARTDIQNHLNDKNNPHGVTNEKIGAMPVTGGKFTGTVTTKGLRLSKDEDYGTEPPDRMEEGKLFLQELPVDDYLLEEGIKNGWYYCKRANGYAECYRTVTATVAKEEWKDSGMMSFLGYGLYWTRDRRIELEYPFVFAEHPIENADMSNGTVWFPIEKIRTTAMQTDKTDSYRLCTYKQPDQDMQITLSIRAVGRWK